MQNEFDDILRNLPFPDVAKDEVAMASFLFSFFEAHGLPQPDRVINLLWMDKMVREDAHVPHPFPGQRKNRQNGVYLILDDTGGPEPFVIYAGMTINFAIRFSQHWNPTNPTTHSALTSWFDRLDNGQYGEVGEDGTPAGCPVAAIWLISEKLKRRQFEHLLIGLLKPCMNQV